jgi:hypothetical protein
MLGPRRCGPVVWAARGSRRCNLHRAELGIAPRRGMGNAWGTPAAARFLQDHVVAVLRAIVEGNPVNRSSLIADVIHAASDIVRCHPRWVELGGKRLQAWDSIDLVAIRKTAKASGIRPMREAVGALLYARLESILGPSVVVPVKPSRFDDMEKRLATGARMLELRAENKNKKFRRLLQVHFKKEVSNAFLYMRVAERYRSRPEIWSMVSWSTLRALTEPSLPAETRSRFERAIAAGRTVRGAHVVRARRKAAEPASDRSDRPAPRMAA